MKPQDIAFVAVTLFLVTRRHRSRSLVTAAVTAIAASAVLFQFWIFFTAQRLLWYATIWILFSMFPVYDAAEGVMSKGDQ